MVTVKLMIGRHLSSDQCNQLLLLQLQDVVIVHIVRLLLSNSLLSMFHMHTLCAPALFSLNISCFLSIGCQAAYQASLPRQ